MSCNEYVCDVPIVLSWVVRADSPFVLDVEDSRARVRECTLTMEKGTVPSEGLFEDHHSLLTAARVGQSACSCCSISKTNDGIQGNRKVFCSVANAYFQTGGLKGAKSEGSNSRVEPYIPPVSLACSRGFCACALAFVMVMSTSHAMARSSGNR